MSSSTTTAVRTAHGSVSSNWRRMRLWATAHAVDDFYQGFIPAVVPYFVLERDYSYLAATGLTMAATLGSALPQLAIGVVADRHRVRWMSPLGVAIAGIGAGLAGIAPSYALVWILLLLSGFGVAMFHPPAGRDARVAAGDSAGAMSYFAAGGSVGFFLAPALATPALNAWGLGATVLFIPPAVLMGFVLLRQHRWKRTTATVLARPSGPDRWGLFGTLTAVEVIRSTASFGVNTFIALYWIDHLGASTLLGGAALTVELVGGVAGTLLGGRLADRFGLTRTVQVGNVLIVPSLIGLLLCTNAIGALPLAFIVGLVLNIPFSVLVTLGQDYLPNRPGTAAGVTLGLAVSAGGLFMPVLGVIADHYGPRGALITLAAIPVIAIALSTRLREPTRSRPTQRAGATHDVN